MFVYMRIARRLNFVTSNQDAIIRKMTHTWSTRLKYRATSMFEGGMMKGEIARKLHVPKSSVCSWVIKNQRCKEDCISESVIRQVRTGDSARLRHWPFVHPALE